MLRAIKAPHDQTDYRDEAMFSPEIVGGAGGGDKNAPSTWRL